MKIIKAAMALIMCVSVLSGCNLSLEKAGAKADKLISEASGQLTEENFKSSLKELGFDPSKYDIRFETGGAVIDLKSDTINEDGIKRINLDRKVAALMAVTKNLEFIEIKAGDKTYRIDRNTIMKDFNINIDELKGSKEKLTDFIKDIVK